MNVEKQLRETNKKLLKQRDEARAEVEALKSGKVNNLEAELLKYQAAHSECGSVHAGLRAEVKRLEETIDKLDHEREVAENRYEALKAHTDKALTDAVNLATNELKQQLALATTELNSIKSEDVKALRKRLQAKTEREHENAKELAEAMKLINTLMRIPAVKDFMAEAKKRAEAVEKAKAEAAMKAAAGGTPAVPVESPTLDEAAQAAPTMSGEGA